MFPFEWIIISNNKTAVRTLSHFSSFTVRSNTDDCDKTLFKHQQIHKWNVEHGLNRAIQMQNDIELPIHE